MTKTKNIKVVYSSRWGSHEYAIRPKIQMEGKWLEEIGFPIGTRLKVEYEEGSIRIRPFTAEENAQEEEQRLLTEMEKNRREHERILRVLNKEMDSLPRVAEIPAGYDAPTAAHTCRHK